MLRIAQVETVGETLAERRDELLLALERERERRGAIVVALMVTDIMAKETQLYGAGDRAALEHAFGDGWDGRRRRAAGRDQPQEAGRAEAALRARRLAPRPLRSGVSG